MFPEWTWVLGLVIGAAIGSFLNVVIYRLPLGLSINEPKHSFCPHCKSQLGIPDLIPLLSWIVSRGRCRHCREAVPARYFIVELVTGGLFALIWHQQLIATWDLALAILYMSATATLVAATFIDLRWFMIPDQLNAALLFSGAGFNVYLVATGRPEAWLWGMPSSVAGAWVGALSIWLITLLGRLLFGKDAMGHGDIKLMRGIGACLLPFGVAVTFGLSIVLGAVIGLAVILLARRQASPAEPRAETADYEPESVGSILKCGIGYALFLDVFGLFAPAFYQRFFGEDPYASVEDDEWEAGLTTIPFGPYLALGAVAFMVAQAPIQSGIDAYLNKMGLEVGTRTGKD